METFSEKCMNDNTVASFCGCIATEENADPAARNFCERAKTDGKKVTGDDLAELKKALKDMQPRCCC